MAKDQTQDIHLGIARLEWGDADRPQEAVLTVKTHKHYNGGLVSSASVFWHGQHSKSQLISMGGGSGDYSKRLKVSERIVKATQKNIDTQHAVVFTAEVVETLTQEAKAHYAAVVAAGIDGYKNVYLELSEPMCTCGEQEGDHKADCPRARVDAEVQRG